MNLRHEGTFYEVEKSCLKTEKKWESYTPYRDSGMVMFYSGNSIDISLMTINVCK
jgi:hypothetical protein